MRHPIQPLVKDENGVKRFKSNRIVERLLEVATQSGYSMNEIAREDFTDDDRIQFAQLIGYSFSGLESLSYVDDDTLGTITFMSEKEIAEKDARISYLEDKLSFLKDHLRDAVACLFEKNLDDL